MSNEVAISGVQALCQAVEKMQGQLSEQLKGTGIEVGRFITTAKTAIQMHPQKDRLEKADRASLFLAIRKAAADGLLPDGREAALVIYGNKEKGCDEVQYQPMVQGLVELARRSGEISSIDAEVVFENDEFLLSYSVSGADFKFTPNFKSDRGAPILVWANIRLKNGSHILRALSKMDVAALQKKSKRPWEYDVQKGAHWAEFWRKGAIRNALKYAPRSSAIEKALESDNAEFVQLDDGVEISEPKKQPPKSFAEKIKQPKEGVIEVEIPSEPEEQTEEDII